MPGPAALPAIIGGLQTAGSIGSSIGANVGGRKFAREMYQRQYDDNVRFWQMQNEYNSPQAQMQRLREAGLNPAMIYGGQGSGAAGQAAPVNSPNPQQPEFKVPDLSGLRELQNNMRSNKLVDAQVDLLEAQKVGTLAKAASEQFGLGIRSEVRDYLVDAVKLDNAKVKSNIRSINASTTVSLHRNEREALINSQNLEIGFEKILNMRADRANTEQQRKNLRAAAQNTRNDSELKRLEILMRKNGVTFNDELWQRLAAKGVNILSKVFEKNGSSIKENAKNFPSIGKILMREYMNFLKN